MTHSLELDDYQRRAIRSDRTRVRDLGIDLPVLGLVGEMGSLLSETKKKQRDAGSYLGYEANVVEEMGDSLWYLSAVAAHRGLDLSALAQGHRTFADLHRNGSWPSPPPPWPLRGRSYAWPVLWVVSPRPALRATPWKT